MNNTKCFDCIKNAIIQKNKLWFENKLTWGEDVELSKTLQSACHYAGVNVNEVASAAQMAHPINAAEEYLKMAAAWKPGQLWV